MQSCLNGAPSPSRWCHQADLDSMAGEITPRLHNSHPTPFIFLLFSLSLHNFKQYSLDNNNHQRGHMHPSLREGGIDVTVRECLLISCMIIIRLRCFNPLFCVLHCFSSLSSMDQTIVVSWAKAWLFWHTTSLILKAMEIDQSEAIYSEDWKERLDTQKT